MTKQENFDLIYDILDEASMLLYEELNINYLDALLRVTNDLIEGIDDSRLDSDALDKLEAIYAKLDNHSFSNEDLRMAYNLLLIKGFKHIKMKLDVIIPDSIALVFANIIRSFYNLDHLNMLEINCKTANLTNTIANFLECDITCFAQEEDELLAKIAKLSSNFQDRDLILYNNKATDALEVDVDTIIGHLESKVEDGKYLPYKLISKLMRYLEEDGIFIFLIDNDFFSYPDLANFQSNFTGTLLGLLILPETMFKGTITKSILIGSKKQINDFDMLAISLPSFADAPRLNEAMIKIENWIKDVSMIIKDN